MLHLVRPEDAPAATSAHQREVDALQAAVRAEGRAARPSIFKPAPPLPRPSKDLLDQRIAEELACIGRRLELLGGTLSGDPILLHRHAAQLQSIDLINQMLGHLARVIATEERAKAIALITLTELKARLQRKSLDG
jgi:hypothetical protein